MTHLRDIAIIGVILYIVFVAFAPDDDGGPEEGKPAPDIEATLMSGETFNLADHTGKSWCRFLVDDLWPCRRSLPALRKCMRR